VTAHAHLPELWIFHQGFLGIEAALQCIAIISCLARSHALFIGQVFDQRAALFIGQLNLVRGLHSPDSHQPAFRSLALVTDTAVLVIALGLVTGRAAGRQQLLRRGGLLCHAHTGLKEQ
jgi:hypothetical protein